MRGMHIELIKNKKLVMVKSFYSVKLNRVEHLWLITLCYFNKAHKSTLDV